MYFDFAATTPIRPEVLAIYVKALEEDWGNPSSQYARGRKAKALLEQARRKLAEIFGLEASAFVFTSGATEANTTILLGNARRMRQEGKGAHIISSIGEHPSVYENCKLLEKEGFEVSYLALDSTGHVNLDAFRSALREDTILVSLMSVNNETGVETDIQSIADILENHQAFFHSDMVQAMGKADIWPLHPRMDAWTATGHKVYAPKGIGFYYQKKAHPVTQIMHGGHQESDRRSGTENLPAVLALVEAFRLMKDEFEESRLAAERLDQYFVQCLQANQIRYEYNGSDQRIPSIHNLHFPGCQASRLLIQLDLAGIEISAGSACSAGALEESRVLRSMFGEGQRVHESVRISFGKTTTKEEIEALCLALRKYVNHESNK